MELSELYERIDELENKARVQGLTSGEEDELRQLCNQADAATARVSLENTFGNQSAGRRTAPDDAVFSNSVRRTAGENAGFESIGELGIAAYRNGLPGAPRDKRLYNAPSTVSTEGTGADGGYLVPPDFRAQIMQRVTGEFSILGLTDTHETPSNSVEFPADETAPWASSGGLQAYWSSEAEQLTQSKVSLKSKTLKLGKLTALIPVSSELLEDAPGLDAYLSKKLPEIFISKLNTAFIEGTGAGEPQGILNADSLVTVSKESGQSADTIMFENIINMWSRLYGPCQRNAVWLINQEIYPQLYQMAWEGTSSSVPAYMPANGLSGETYGVLMGRPVIPLQACKALGDLGDILLCDWKQYFVALKNTGIRQDVSMHLWFDYDVMAFRFILRIAGLPWWSSAISGYQSGVSTLGCFVGLQART